MNYELAKEMRAAGFPQEGKGEWLQRDMSHPMDWDKSFTLYSPTLEELIGKCGDRFSALGIIDGIWKATDGGILMEEGKNPTIAVAKLWLALNKKK